MPARPGRETSGRLQLKLREPRVTPDCPVSLIGRTRAVEKFGSPLGKLVAPPPPPYGSQYAHGKLASIGAFVFGCSGCELRTWSRFGMLVNAPSVVLGGGVVLKVPPGPVP